MVSSSLVAALLCLLCACSHPSDNQLTSNPEPPGAEPDAAGHQKPGRLGVQVTTVEDVARALGLHHDYLYVTNLTCQQSVKCRSARGDKTFMIDMCEQFLAEEWCSHYDCMAPILSEPVSEDPCIADINSRTCENLHEPLRCPRLEELGQELSPTAWPKGDPPDIPWPPRRGR